MDWKTKPTDRFLLRMTKIYLSAPLTRAALAVHPDLRPSSLTLLAT